MNYSINLDWLQLNFTGHITPNYIYKITELEFQTRHFKKIYEIHKNGILIGTAATKPHSSILRPDMVLMKFDNKLLYDKLLKNYVLEFIDVFKLKFINVTRLDISIDFNRFYNNILPEKFIRDFVNCIYLKNGRGKFNIIGSQDFFNTYEYLRFGTHKSGKCIYLYNKSKEFRQVKMKHYIVDTWKENNINVDDDVWRLEASLHGNKFVLLDKDNGDYVNIDINSLFNPSFQSDLMSTCVNDMFSFKVFDGTKNKSRMKDLKLFDSFDSSKKLFKLSSDIDSNRSDKIFLKKLMSFNNEIRGSDFELNIALDSIISNYVRSRRLYDYYEKLS